MPSASYKPPRPIADLEEAAEILRSEGMRFSASRRVVLEGLLVAEGPVSAERLADGLGGRISPCDLPSVYRNMELFERLGIVRHVHIGHGPGLYALVAADEHTYLVCEHCNRLSRLPPTEAMAIRDRIAAATGFEAHFTHFPILGLCASCAGKEAVEAPNEGVAMHHGDPEEHERADGHGHEHGHDDAHSHQHSHDGETHSHPHDAHDHDHVAHSHEHSHGDRVHSHTHVHQEGLEKEHEHAHED